MTDIVVHIQSTFFGRCIFGNIYLLLGKYLPTTEAESHDQIQFILYSVGVQCDKFPPDFHSSVMFLVGRENLQLRDLLLISLYAVIMTDPKSD